MDNRENTLDRVKTRWSLSCKVGVAIAILILSLVAGAIYQTKVYYRDIGDPNKPKDLSANALKTAESYEELYGYIKKAHSSRQTIPWGAMTSEITQDMSKSADAPDSFDAQTSYSQTNLRETGVDEGDIVKTDGRYLYVLKTNRDKVAIVDTSGEQMTQISVVAPEAFQSIVEFYVTDNKLVLVGGSTIMGIQPLEKTIDSSDMEDENRGEDVTSVATYDISDKSNPVHLGSMSQSGNYHSSRIVEGYLYLFSNYNVYGEVRRGDATTYVPKINQKLIAGSDIYLPTVESAEHYTVITAMSLLKPDRSSCAKSILSMYGQFYVSEKNIYFYEQKWDDDGRTQTSVRRLSYKDGQIEAKAKGEFNGYLNDSFSIDEYKNHLRVVTTVGDRNCLYILDDGLEISGRIEGLAKDERIYSARLMGEIGYFVTFKEVDPLFSVDLSDPTSPKIKGALKIPGFSQYLHPYGEGRLLAIGMDIDENTGVTGGLKLSMFDVSDAENVTEIAKLVLDTDYYSALFYNYKGFMGETSRNLFGFSSEGEGGLRYHLFTYDNEAGFLQLLNAEVNTSGYMETRGVLIDDTLYIISGNIIESYSLKTYEKVESVIL